MGVPHWVLMGASVMRRGGPQLTGGGLAKRICADVRHTTPVWVSTREAMRDAA